MLVAYNELSDERIIKLHFEQRDPQALSFIFKKYLPLVFGIALKYCRHEQNAEDVSMQVFEKLLLMSDSSILNFKSWLCMVTRNMALEFIDKDKKKREKSNNFEESASNFMENGEEIHLISEDKLNMEQMLIKMESQLHQLKEEQRICIERFYLKNQTYQEIAEDLNVTTNHVKSNIQNGKRKLKILMDNKNE